VNEQNKNPPWRIFILKAYLRFHLCHQFDILAKIICIFKNAMIRISTILVCFIQNTIAKAIIIAGVPSGSGVKRAINP
jgi:hypothetical protein